ncbi:MAG: hypothetical protein HY360_20140 [Verrucomicrobia bacterium]|nr:hypothetical protein [Verrucomicrobiota bacterium]
MKRLLAIRSKDRYSYGSVESVLKHVAVQVASLVLLSGCGGHAGHHQDETIFKGRVMKVEYILTRGVTVLTDSEGKRTELQGHPGVPCAEIEIHRRGQYEYEVFQAAGQK